MHMPSAREGVRSEINVTPLVDVCLVLLIIFMVVTPLMTRELPIQLPQTGRPGPPTQDTRPLRVAMLEDQTVLVENAAIPWSELPDMLRGLQAANPDRPVLVQGDKRLRYEQLSRLLESLDDAGFRQVGLMTVRRGREG
jgi:biopolymer transport protein TolR